MYKAFLIKYAEIGIKGKNRYMFEDALVRQSLMRMAICSSPPAWFPACTSWKW